MRIKKKARYKNVFEGEGVMLSSMLASVKGFNVRFNVMFKVSACVGFNVMLNVSVNVSAHVMLNVSAQC